MNGLVRPLQVSLVAILVFGGGSAPALEAQSRGNRGGAVAQQAITLSAQVKAQIGDFYSSRRVADAQALPPGIRRRLERGKPLPPGIAKKSAPPELISRLTLPEGFEIVEVGLDVFLVEVATDMIHDVLMDVIR